MNTPDTAKLTRVRSLLRDLYCEMADYCRPGRPWWTFGSRTQTYRHGEWLSEAIRNLRRLEAELAARVGEVAA